MLKRLHSQKQAQRIIGLLVGIIFGFLLQKGGVSDYDVIIGQLLLTDFTVLKIMLSAVVVGMMGIHALKGLGCVALHPKSGSIGGSLIGGLIFGVGFAILGYCPGTVAAAVGQGSLDALAGGVVGILIGCGLFAAFYPWLDKSILHWGEFGELTFPQLLKVNSWAIIIPLITALLLLIHRMESAGL
jgi:hypothetical protein